MTGDYMMDGWRAEIRDRSIAGIAGKISKGKGLNQVFLPAAVTEKSMRSFSRFLSALRTFWLPLVPLHDAGGVELMAA
jgi:hypothetical protein